MRPDSETNNAFFYCLAEAAQRFGIEVLFTIANTNHHHTGIHDPRGTYPAFLEHFHKLFAKCQNSLRGRWENFWASEQTSVVRLVDPEDALRKMTYALANPVKDHLVARAHHWPGATSLFAHTHGRAIRARRPRHFFRATSHMPAEVELRLRRIPGFEHLTGQQWAELVAERVAAAEHEAADVRAAEGRRVMGRAAVLRQKWWNAPTSRAPWRRVSPTIAARRPWARDEALGRNRAFIDAYRVARDAFLRGVAGTVFPAGTYWLRRFASVPCAAACFA